MKKIILSLVSIASLQAFAADPIVGKNIYMTSPPIPCATCHGTDISKNTANILKGKSSVVISSAIASNKGNMGMYASSLTTAQIDDIAAYIINPNGTVANPSISLSSNVVNFPATEVNKASSIQSIVVSNTGTANLVISGLFLAGFDSNDFILSGSCNANTSIIPKNSCSIGIVFNSKTVGSKSASLTIANNTDHSQTVNLSATAISTPIITPIQNPIPSPKPIIKPPISGPILVPKDHPAVRNEREYQHKNERFERNDRDVEKNKNCNKKDCNQDDDHRFK